MEQTSLATSLQASHGRVSAPATPSFPWRVVIMVEGGRDILGRDIPGWAIYQVYEEATEAEAMLSGELTAIEVLDEPGVTNAHFYVGEVANG